MKLYFIYPEWCRRLSNLFAPCTGRNVVKRTLIIISAMLVFAGCNRSDRSKPNSSGQGYLSREQAKKILWDLPEVVQWSNDVRRKHHGRTVPVCTVERTPTQCLDRAEKPAWIFYFGMSSPDETILWNRFRVDAKTGAVGVWDPFKGKYITLEQWRQKNQLRRRR